MSKHHLTSEDLEAFKQDLVRTLKTTRVSIELPRWVKSWQVMQMLGVSKGKLRQWRIQGKLPYVKIDGLIFYDLEDINKLMKGQF